MELLPKLLPLTASLWGSVPPTLLRLVVAAILGGIVGLEREARHKPAGLRTQMFICFGSAFFTLLSGELAGNLGGDHTRIAAQIIPGIGFIGAGTILHARGSVTGITTAASLFVVASIGMAVGGGLYLPAVFATLLLLAALRLLGLLEARYSLKPLVHMYEAVGTDVEDVLNTVNDILSDEHQAMRTVHISRTAHTARVQFSLEATRSEQDAVLQLMRQSAALQRVQDLGPTESE
jgi:putative Mg2+ transporter-C (MgtC) family protein